MYIGVRARARKRGTGTRTRTHVRTDPQTTVSIQKRLKRDAINIVCGGRIHWNEYRIKPKFIFYFIRPTANIVPWLPTRSTEP